MVEWLKEMKQWRWKQRVLSISVILIRNNKYKLKKRNLRIWENL